MPVPPIRGHLPCRDTFAWKQKCPLKAGTTVCVYIGGIFIKTLYACTYRNNSCMFSKADAACFVFMDGNGFHLANCVFIPRIFAVPWLDGDFYDVTSSQDALPSKGIHIF